MGMKFKVGDFVRLTLGGENNYRIKYGVIVETGVSVPPISSAYSSNKTKTSAFISVIWVGTSRRHVIYKEFLKNMWERIDTVARA